MELCEEETSWSTMLESAVVESLPFAVVVVVDGCES